MEPQAVIRWLNPVRGEESLELFVRRIQEWLVAHPRVHQIYIPKGACWLNLQEGWWRLFRREPFAGQSFADSKEIEQATELATRQLNRRAKPWVWGRPARCQRQLRRRLAYCL